MSTDSNTNTVDVSTDSLEPPSWMDSLRRFCLRVLRELSISNWELSILLTDDTRMAELNARYRATEGPTDVLSFAALDGISAAEPPEGPVVAGDLVVDVPLVTRQAAEWGVEPEEELRRVVIHGVLHLAGHDHTTNDSDTEPMLRLQERILQSVKEKIY